MGYPDSFKNRGGVGKGLLAQLIQGMLGGITLRLMSATAK